MSDTCFITPASIQAIAHSIDITRLSDEAAKALSPDVDYRLREIIQDAKKFARHGRRTKLTVEDINSALRLRNVEPVYGFGDKDPAKFVRATGHPDVCLLQDRELSFDRLLDAPLPPPPVEVNLMPHWLFIDGVQPSIPENAPIDRPVVRRGARAAAGAAAAVAQTKGGARAAAGAADGAHGRDGAVHGGGGGGGAPGAASAAALASGAVRVAAPVQHMLSRELQLYFDKLVTLLKAPAKPEPERDNDADVGASTSGAWDAAGAPGDAPSGSGATAAAAAAPESVRLRRAALVSLATDPGLHPLAPYLTKFVADEIASGLKSLHALRTTLDVATALLSNPHVRLEHYVHQLLPPVLTCLVAKSLGSGRDDHWHVREQAAAVVKAVCARFSDPFYNVQPRISKTLLKALLDPTKPLATHYGAVIGLSALGHATVGMLLVPQLAPYMARLAPLLEDSSHGARRDAAHRVHGALLDAVATSLYERMVAAAAAGLPSTLLPPPRARKPRGAAAAATASAAADADGGGEDRDGDAEADGDGDVEMADAEPEPARRGGRGTARGKAAGGAKGKPAVAAAAPKGKAAAAGAGKRGRGARGAPEVEDDEAAAAPEPPAPAPAPASKAAAAAPAPRPLRTALSSGLAPLDGDGDAGALVHSILADSWRSDADFGRVVWALTQLFHEDLLARLPLAHPPSLFL
ncbi:hypothetical protein FOA52_004948 [Chlamydomonas sp. UWO 241]|nr:hypothetical protein FOA52_004948 [Chlamydomonas sp. UWO 241]